VAGNVAEYELIDLVVEKEAVEKVAEMSSGRKKNGGDVVALNFAETAETKPVWSSPSRFPERYSSYCLHKLVLRDEALEHYVHEIGAHSAIMLRSSGSNGASR
jgi:hypothetical protein